MTSNRILVPTEQKGCTTCGTPFDDRPSPENLERVSVTCIDISHGQLVNSLTVHYTGTVTTAAKHGGSGTTLATVALAPGEWVTSIEGAVGGCNIGQLTFVTNMRRYGPYGQTATSSFVWNVPNADREMGLLYFTGRASSDHLVALQATFADIRQPNHKPASTLLRFENTTLLTPPDPALSSFSRNLLSPSVTLRIGPTNTTFYVPKDLLCRLSFFRAALTGSFREATEGSITMPEDTPETVAALIEWLYNGCYTYVYSSSANTPPPNDLAQGTFHVSVYAVAAKYDCQALADEAMRNFAHVLEGLDGAECLGLWKAAYANDLPLIKWKPEDEMKGFGQRLVRILKGMYEQGVEVEEVFEQFPRLATDVLRLAVTSGSLEG